MQADDKADDEALVTVTGGVKLVRETLGVPVPKSRFYKDSAAGRAPKPDAIYGRTFLFKPSKMLAWGRSLIRPFSSEAAE